MRLKDKVAIVTGASKGLGKVIAQIYGKEGANVILTARTENELIEVRDSIINAGGQAEYHLVDMMDKTQIKKCIDAVGEKYGRIDILVNNAGIGAYAYAVDDPSEEAEDRFEDVVRTNLNGCWYAARYVAPYMKAQKDGVILNIASVRGMNALANETAYCATKGGIIQLTRCLAVEFAPHNIRVNTISPGSIPLDVPAHWMKYRYGEEFHKEYTEKFMDVHMLGLSLHQPMARMGKPEDIAYAAVYLGSDEAKFVSGTNLVVDGALTCVLTEPVAVDLPKYSEYYIKSQEAREWIKAHA